MITRLLRKAEINHIFLRALKRQNNDDIIANNWGIRI